MNPNDGINTSDTTSVKESLPPMDGLLMGPNLVTPWQPLGVALRIIDVFSMSRPTKSFTRNRLVTITSSVYAEKTRFALDLLGDRFDYLEDIHSPALHAGFALRVTQNQQSRTPILVTTTTTPSSTPMEEEGLIRILSSSEEIVQTMCPHLYPTDIADQIQALEHEWGQILGAATRSLYYVSLLQLEEEKTTKKPHTFYHAMTQLCTAGVTAVEAFLFHVMLDKGVDQGICDCLQLSAAANKVAAQVLEETFKKLSRHVDQHKLVGDETSYWMDTQKKKYGFTAADLCLAVYVANCCGDVPALEGLSTNVFKDDSALPVTLAALRNRLRATSVAAYARRIYRQHRPVDPQTGRIVIRSARRDKSPWLVLGAAAALGLAIATASLMGFLRRR